MSSSTAWPAICAEFSCRRAVTDDPPGACCHLARSLISGRIAKRLDSPQAHRPAIPVPYLQTYGYVGANPAHSDFVAAPSAPCDGKTVGLAPEDCRRLLDAPSELTPLGLRDRALLAVLAYTGCRVGEIVRLKVGDCRYTGGHTVLQILGKGGKERTVPLHPEAVERIATWLAVPNLDTNLSATMFPAAVAARGHGRSGFEAEALSRRAVQKLVEGYVRRLKLDPHVSVHSLRVTALTTARERGSDIIDLQDFAGHSDPRTTLTYIRSRDRLSKSPAYVIRY